MRAFAWNHAAFNSIKRIISDCVDTLSTNAYDDFDNPIFQL